MCPAEALCLASYGNVPKLVSMLVFGLSMIELYTVSAIYHIGPWQGMTHRVLRAVDHSNIFLVIAGTYTPICINVLSGPLRTALFIAIWVFALAGVVLSVVTIGVPRVIVWIPRW